MLNSKKSFIEQKKKIEIVITQLPPSEDGGLLWSKDHFLRLKVACEAVKNLVSMEPRIP